MREEQVEGEAGVEALAARERERKVRQIAHDINGALNNAALNLELLERAAAKSGEEADAARERSIASLRRAVSAIGRIVTDRLLPLASPGADESR